MIQDRKSKKGAAAGLIFAAVVLVLVVLLENLSSLLPSVPAVLQPTSQLFTVLKKGAVYSLVAVSMNLLNGFTGLFGYASTIVSGAGLGYLAQHYGWNHAYIAMIAMALVGMAVFLLMWGAGRDGYETDAE